jgi:hypothetical protein
MSVVNFLKMGQFFKQHLIQHERTASWAVALALVAHALGLVSRTSFRKTAQLLSRLGAQISHLEGEVR